MTKLEDLVDRDIELNLNSIEETLHLRKFTLGDEIWLRQQYGHNLEKVFNSNDLDYGVITRIAYRLLREKTLFRAKSYSEYDEDGHEKKKTIGGHKLFGMKIDSVNEKISLVNAVVSAIGAEDDSKESDPGEQTEKK